MHMLWSSKAALHLTLNMKQNIREHLNSTRPLTFKFFSIKTSVGLLQLVSWIKNILNLASCPFSREKCQCFLGSRCFGLDSCGDAIGRPLPAIANKHSFTVKFIFHGLFLSIKPCGLMLILHTWNSHDSFAWGLWSKVVRWNMSLKDLSICLKCLDF